MEERARSKHAPDQPYTRGQNISGKIRTDNSHSVLKMFSIYYREYNDKQGYITDIRTSLQQIYDGKCRVRLLYFKGKLAPTKILDVFAMKSSSGRIIAQWTAVCIRTG